MDQILELLRTDPDKCVEQLQVFLKGKENDLEALQLAAEVHFELGNGELAYEALMRSLELDPEGKLGGTNKFLWIAQLTGGQKGLEYYELGIDNMDDKNQIVQALLGMIEIWMTDLCMEEPAEHNCETLIAKAILTDDQNPEVYSILGSIRISQQRNKEAQEALMQSWELYQKTANVTSMPAIIRLAQSMLEVGLFDEVLDLTTICSKIDDEIPDLYYLNALAHKSSYQNNNEDRHAAGARDAIELMLTLPLVDPEMAEAGKELIADLPQVEVPESDDDGDQQQEDEKVE